MNEETLQSHKEALLEERKRLEHELSTVGRRNPNNPEDWIPSQGELNIDQADPNEQADADEAFERNAAILNDLEIRYTNVRKALERIKEGSYGICVVCHEPIEERRLEANQAAPTCIKHKDAPY